MKTTHNRNLLAAALVGTLAFTSAHAADFTHQELKDRTVARRAVDTVIWGVPAVTLDMMRQAYLRDGQGGAIFIL